MPAGPRPTPPTRCVKLVYNGHYGGAPWANVMWLFVTGSGVISTTDLNNLAGACRARYVTRFLPLLSSVLELQSTQVVLYSDGDALEGNDATIATGGHASGSRYPANIACCISWNIAPVYRGGHARTYLAGLSSDQGAAVNTWDAAFLTSLRAAAGSFHTDLEAITGVGTGITSVEHGVVSFVRAGAWRTPPVFYRITGAAVDARIDTQRRRLGPDFP